MVRDPLAGLAALPEVSPAVDAARDAVDTAYRHPRLRRHGGPVVAEVALRCAVASAALADSRHELEQVRAGTVTDPVVQGALRCAEALPGMVDQWRRTPRQVLARLHVLAARGVVPDAELGRPSNTDRSEVAARLDTLLDVVLAQAAPGLLRAAVVHGELLALSAFAGPNGVLARAAARLELLASGFDPRGLVPVDVQHQAREPEYVGGVTAFASGTPDGVRSWLRHCAAAAESGAAAAQQLADDWPPAHG